MTTTFSGYDGLIRPVVVTYSDGTPSIAYTDDSDWKGTLSSVTTGTGTSTNATTYTHDTIRQIATGSQKVNCTRESGRAIEHRGNPIGDIVHHFSGLRFIA